MVALRYQQTMFLFMNYVLVGLSTLLSTLGITQTWISLTIPVWASAWLVHHSCCGQATRKPEPVMSINSSGKI